MSNFANIDPEEVYVAAILSCYMFTFLHVARIAGFQFDVYEDEVVGDMVKNAEGVSWVATVMLNLCITYGGDKRPFHEEEIQLHHKVHHGCFIAQSIKIDVKVIGYF